MDVELYQGISISSVGVFIEWNVNLVWAINFI